MELRVWMDTLHPPFELCLAEVEPARTFKAGAEIDLEPVRVRTFRRTSGWDDEGGPHYRELGERTG